MVTGLFRSVALVVCLMRKNVTSLIMASLPDSGYRTNMRERRRKFTPEFKDEAVKMVIESSRPVAEVAREIQVNEGTLGNWVHKYRVDHAGEELPLSISERARLRELEREVRELKMKAEFLGKAAAFFAQEYR
jgi:transposase